MFFQVKREDSDLRSIQDAMKKANEMDAVFLEDIEAASPKFGQVIAKSTMNNTDTKIVFIVTSVPISGGHYQNRK